MQSPWAIDITEILKQLSVDPELGLYENELEQRLQKFGPNSIKVKKKKSRWLIFIKQFKNPVVYVLLVAFILAFALQEYMDSWAIMSILILNAIIGFIQESKAEASIEALASITSPKGKVLREGKILEVNSHAIYPGDILVLEAGDYVVADARIISSHQLAADEAILTGESLSVDKDSKPIKEVAALADRVNMLFASTAISRGTARAVVISTGMLTEIGKIADMMETSMTENTPLQIRLERVSRRLLFLGIILIVLVIIIGIVQERDIATVMMSALSLAVSAIPEGLPTVVTIALVMAVRRMSKKKALVRKLDSVETLGATDIICTDKTGTLTTGKMKVRESYLAKEEETDQFFHALVLCNNASLDGEGSGDTTELALLVHARNDGTDIKKLHMANPRLNEWSFDSKRKRMSVAVKSGDKVYIHVKGASESILPRCELSTEEIKEIEQRVSNYSKKGMRVLAFAYRESPGADLEKMSMDEAEQQLHFLGLVAMADPPREETIHAVRKCQSAGVRIMMITGDHPQTAAAIAYELEIIKSADARVLTGPEMDLLSESELMELSNYISVYARVSPENKLKLVNALKGKGHIVAMTGDGVNDGPALKTASIGIAMGKGGTEVARQASSMILTDDNFATIVDAVEEGRAVNGNIKRTLQYLLSTNLAELIFILGATIIGWPIPLLSINILWVNLVTDGLPSLALAAEGVPENYLLESTKPSSDTFFDRAFYQEMILVSIVIGIISLGVYYYGLTNFDTLTARSLAFSFLVYIVLFRSFSCRSETKTFFELKPNIYHLVAVVVPMVFQLVFQEFDFLLEVFKVKALPLEVHLILLGLALIPITIVEVFKIWSRK
jgi:P-type Ca2+ transporter type 2C